MKFLVSADLHLGRSSSGSARADNERSSSAVWQAMVHYAVRHSVDAVLLSGDIIDRENRYFEALPILKGGIDTLQVAGIPVILTAGNHDFDVLSAVLESANQQGVHFLGQGGRWSSVTLTIKGQAVRFIGWSFPDRYFMDSPLNSPDLPPVDSEIPTIGLLHCDFGIPDSPYAPVPKTAFDQSPADVWVLGHIHKPEIRRQNPLCLYPGSPQPLSAKESGWHGAWLLNYQEGRFTAERAVTSSIRFDSVPVDVSETRSQLDLNQAVYTALDQFLAEILPAHENGQLLELVAHLEFTGTHEDLPSLRRWTDGIENTAIRGVKITVRSVSDKQVAAPLDLPAIRQEKSPAGVLATAILDIEHGRNSEFLDKLRGEMADKIRKLNSASAYTVAGGDPRFEPVQPDDTIAIDRLITNQCRQLLGQMIAGRMS